MKCWLCNGTGKIENPLMKKSLTRHLTVMTIWYTSSQWVKPEKSIGGCGLYLG